MCGIHSGRDFKSAGRARAISIMTSKRKNPFGEVAPIQLKVHVSAKHVASKEDMEEVYSKLSCSPKLQLMRTHTGRTRERLFHAGKSSPESNGHCVQQEGAKNVLCRCCKRQILSPGATCKNCWYQVCGQGGCLQECCTCGQSFCQFCTVLK
jgi:hypothetical protein